MKCRSLLLAAGLTGALLVGATGTAQAADKVPSGCTGARQLGATAYVTDGAGANIASVKQYYGVCGGTPKNWSYVYVWQSFYDSGKSYNIKAAILVGSSTEGAGFRSAARPTRELNSTPVATTGSCTRAFGGYDLASSTRTAKTAQDC